MASRALDRAQAYAAEWKIPRALGSYEALVGDPEIDVIYIGLPNSLHVEWTVRALEAGKHVLCEKPLALTVEDVDRIQAAATRASRVAAEAFMYRHHPLTRRRAGDRQERTARRRPRIQGGVHVSADARRGRAARHVARRRLALGRRVLSRQLCLLPRGCGAGRSVRLAAAVRPGRGPRVRRHDALRRRQRRAVRLRLSRSVPLGDGGRRAATPSCASRGRSGPMRTAASC